MTKFIFLKSGKLEISARSKGFADAAATENTERFIKDYSDLFNRLDKLLNLDRFFNVNKGSVLQTRLKKIVHHWNNGAEQCRTEFCMLSLFTSDLELLHEKEPRIFASFRKELTRQKSSSSWQGLRFELHTAAYLVRTKCSVLKRESPDFCVSVEDTDIFIESSSAMVVANKDKGHLYKIKSTINKKNKKPYANKNTALFIDITNIVHHEFSREQPEDFELLHEELSANQDLKYGAIVIFCMVMNYENMRYESVYGRVPLDGCSDGLTTFLNTFFPYGNYEPPLNSTIPEAS